MSIALENANVYDARGHLTFSASFKLEDGSIRAFNVASTDPRYDEIMAMFQDFDSFDAEELFNLLSVEKLATDFVDALSEFDNGRFEFDLEKAEVTYDGELLSEEITQQIIRMAKNGSAGNRRHLRALMLFIERLYKNQSEFVRKQLFGWLNYVQSFETGLTITDDGCLLGYKGCAWGEDEDGEKIPVSVYSGHAFADGVEYENAQIPNKVGSVISMPRAEVTDDPTVGCSAGLHIGTYSYANDWARGALLLVKVDPRDIVSVPTECNAQKIRASRYEVLEITEVEYTEPVFYCCDDEEDEEYGYDYDDEYGDYETWRCPECLEENEEDETYCFNCGF